MHYHIKQIQTICTITTLFILSAFLSVSITASAATPKETARSLTLAKEFKEQNVIGWAMSEKLDGVRGFWDGKRLVSRGGYYFDAPKDFTKNFPPFALDGELFGGRGKFEQTSATVRASNGWSGIKLHVFDVPHAKGGLYERLQKAKDWLKKHPECNFTVIAQHQVKSLEQAKKFLHEIEAKGGEGVIFRNPNLPYESGRSDGFLKWKSKFDDECTVKEIHEGKGKYAGKMGSLTCENERGRFRIGSGFKDTDRKNPPPVGAKITYRYRGLTAKGLPRFATYLRRYNEN